MPEQTLSDNLQYGFTKLAASSTFFFAILDKNHQYHMVNERYAELSGLCAADLNQSNDSDTFGMSYYNALLPYYRLAFNGESSEGEVELSRHGYSTALHFSITPLTQEGEVQHILFQASDTSEQKQLLNSLHESENKFLALSTLISDGLLLVENNTILSANAKAVQLLGFNDTHYLLGERLSALFSLPNSNTPLPPSFLANAVSPRLCQTNFRCATQRPLSMSSTSTQLWGEQSYLVLLKETTIAKGEKTETHQPATHIHVDPLSGLVNRFGFTRRLEQFIHNETPLLMLYIDLDNFKSVNDSLGHHIGDKVIREISNRLKRILPKHGVLGHLGADEFAIIWPNPEYAHAAEMLSDRVITLINQPFDLQYFSKRMSCSIGCVVYPDNGLNSRTLLQNADTAMFEAKERGRNRLVTYDSDMNKAARARLWLEIELQKALQKNGLDVWYQPKVDAKTLEINGAEALVRWKHPVEGYISPGSFIPVAEKSGLIDHLGRVIIREVFNTVKRWKTKNILPGRVAINLSPEQFGNHELLEFLERQLNSTGISPSCITFELTESAVMSNSQHTQEMLRAIKNMGFALSIDDFGTGYSSLAYLARFPIDELKIDRGFINDINQYPKQITVIENIINLGKSLNLELVAEGIETQEQATLLAELNCNTIQGFFYHRPQPKEEIEELFIQHHKRKHPPRQY